MHEVKEYTERLRRLLTQVRAAIEELSALVSPVKAREYDRLVAEINEILKELETQDKEA